MANMNHKLENEERINELNPLKTLGRIGLGSDTVFFDYGAGTGVFTLPAAEITSSAVYAYDVDEEMAAILKDKIEEAGNETISILTNVSELRSVEKESVDLILMSTVYHHIEDIEALFSDFEHLLKDSGKIVVIEFHEHVTPLGPSEEIRMSKEAIINDFTIHGYDASLGFPLGENMHCLVFEKVPE